MKKRETRSALEVAAAALRGIMLAAQPGELVGGEEALISRIGCSRSTMRQAARLLEREGLLKVRRGINGGYFASRPDATSIEAAVSTYLEYLNIDNTDITVLASALWVEAMRKAATAPRADTQAMADRILPKVRAIKDHAPFDKIRELELKIQSEIFDLAKSEYVRLIFDINVAFSRRRFSVPLADDESDQHLSFVQAWKDAKFLEVGAIVQGDVDLAGMAGQLGRKIWHRRIQARFSK